MSNIQIISLSILIVGIGCFYALGIWGIMRMNAKRLDKKNNRF